MKNALKIIALLGATVLASTGAHAQSATFPPFADPQAAAPKAIAQTQLVGEYPVGSFLESLVVERDSLVVSDYVRQSVSRIDKKSGALKIIATFPTNVGGIAAYGEDYVVNKLSQSGEADDKGQPRRLCREQAEPVWRGWPLSSASRWSFFPSRHFAQGHFRQRSGGVRQGPLCHHRFRWLWHLDRECENRLCQIVAC